MTKHVIRKKIEIMQKKRLASKDVVNLAEYKNVCQKNLSKTVLVVDDDEVTRRALKRVLDHHKYKTLLAEDALEFSKILEVHKLDLILLDINLPWVDGFEICEMLKNHPTLKHVPLIMITTRKNKEDIETALALGADDYITKPFDLQSVINSIQTYI